MPHQNICWICAGEFAEPWPRSGDLVHVSCTTCGRYDITGSLIASAYPLPESERYRMSFWCKRRQLEGREPPLLSSHAIAAVVAQLPNPATHEKPDLLLASLTLRSPRPGEYIRIDDWRERSLACARDQSELNFFIRCLLERQEVSLCPPGIEGIVITGRGWERAAQLLDRPETSKAAFVAMKFNEEMLPLWRSAFAPAIERAGFTPRLANDPQHNEQIDAHIITELKQCRFVIADVTFAAAGVYFEAGYALGMGRSVIWTCRRDRHKIDMHFDTRQYNHILWDTPDDLREELYYRIVATI